MISSKNILGVVFYSLLFLGCKKDGSIPSPSGVNCLPITVIRESDHAVVLEASYVNGKLSVLKEYDAGKLDEINSFYYDGDTIRVTITDTLGNILSASRLKIGSNGMAEKAIRISKGITSAYDTTFYTYDSDNYLIRSITKRTSVYNWGGTSSTIDTNIYVVFNGNTVSEVLGQMNEQFVLEYYSDQENLCQTDLYGTPFFGMDYTGRRNKNPIKKRTSLITNNTVEFQYEYDSNNNVIKEILKETVGGNVSIDSGMINYECF